MTPGKVRWTSSARPIAVLLSTSSLAALPTVACRGEDDVVARYLAPPRPSAPELEPEPELEPQEPRLLALTGDLDVSDSSVIAGGDRFYLYQTGAGISTKSSADLLHWEGGPAVFDANPEWIATAVPDATILWAPDVAQFGGAYHLYYAVSTFGSTRSCIGHATSEALGGYIGAGLWVDQGSVLCSNVDTSDDNWNAIDPHVLAVDDEVWMVFGSFSSGVHLVQLDETTGGRLGEGMVRLATRSDDAIQAPVLVEEGGRFYLFASVGHCCAGVDSTREVLVGRSDSITGPYVDRAGVPLLEGGGTILVSSDERWRGPGGSTILKHEDRSYLVFHAYDAEHDARSTLRISDVTWDEEGWPRVAGP